MKYMTKDWHNTMQKSYTCGILQVDKKADKFSEDYFQKLYEKKKEEAIKEFEEMFEY